jgi:hypothetical protein
LANDSDAIARTLDNRLRNSSFPNIGTTCMKDAPAASNRESYKCGDGDKDFYVPPDSTDYNRQARCSECFTKALQVLIDSFLDLYYTCSIRYARLILSDDHQPEKQNLALWFVLNLKRKEKASLFFLVI